MRTRAAAAVLLLVGSAGLSGVSASAGPAAAAPPPQCDPIKVGGSLGGTTPWAQTRLDFQRAWTVTKGNGVVVAVIDTGVDPRHEQLQGVRFGASHNVLPGFPPGNVTDCSGSGHGTMVTGIIAAQHSDQASFVGVAPDVTIVAIKQTNTGNSGDADGIAAGINAAIDAKARVVNISVTVSNPEHRLDAALARAAKANLIIVAAAGNDGAGQNLPAYPAAFSTQYPNIIAVSASDAQDAIAPFSETGSYVDVAAPGVGLSVAAPVRGYNKVDGTSFAAPYVTGTVALVLAAHPDLTAAQVRDRIEATADRPPATVPDRRYGYGIINPYLAVTSVRDDSVAAPTPTAQPPFPAVAAAPTADRHQAHLALATGAALLGLAVLAATGAAVLRGRRSVEARRETVSAG